MGWWRGEGRERVIASRVQEEVFVGGGRRAGGTRTGDDHGSGGGRVGVSPLLVTVYLDIRNSSFGKESPHTKRRTTGICPFSAGVSGLQPAFCRLWGGHTLNSRFTTPASAHPIITVHALICTLTPSPGPGRDWNLTKISPGCGQSLTTTQPQPGRTLPMSCCLRQDPPPSP